MYLFSEREHFSQRVLYTNGMKNTYGPYFSTININISVNSVGCSRQTCGVVPNSSDWTEN